MYGEYKLLDIFSPSSGLEQFLQRQKTLVNVNTQDRIEVVRSLHLGAKAHDNDDLFVGIELAETFEKFVRNLSRIFHDLLAQLLQKLFVFRSFEIVRIETQSLQVANEEQRAIWTVWLT